MNIKKTHTHSIRNLLKQWYFEKFLRQQANTQFTWADPYILKRRGASQDSSEKGEMLGHFLGIFWAFFVNFTHEGAKISDNRGLCQPSTPSGSATDFDYNTSKSA